MGDLTPAENAGIHRIYDRANGSGRAALQMFHSQFPDRRMPDHVIFQQLHRQLRETHSFHVTTHYASQRRAVSGANLVESILNIVADRPESSTRTVAHHVSVGHQVICRVLRENRLHLFHFQRVQALNPVDYRPLLPVGGKAIGLPSPCVEQLL
ncbi:uncharacterized protein TNCV_2868351 [Trichonephila clavipes]|nr:uncharacterized protein TNCV_2868351 [Trichonephila clavipes]